jgi:diguanylate cyclase (GGDEF)-like protein
MRARRGQRVETPGSAWRGLRRYLPRASAPSGRPIAGRVRARLDDLGRLVSGWARRGPGQRSLIADILLMQLAFALFVSGLAAVGLWWTSSWVIRDNLHKWGAQWVSELDVLGVPLYVSDDAERFWRIEDYVSNFSEIAFVRFYANDGRVLFADSPGTPANPPAPLDTAAFDRLAALSPEDGSLALDASSESASLVRIGKPIWSEALSADDMLGFDPEAETRVEKKLMGFVELGLDFSSYQAQLSRNVYTVSALSVSVLMLLALCSWLVLRRALRPLAELQHPLERLAEGRTDFRVQTSGHREIAAISEALNTTVTALKERDEKLWQVANYDPLTGLLNRHRFMEILADELTRVGRSERGHALLFIDLDQFKYVNDTLGHAAGDRLLKHAAQRLEAAVRKNDLVSRFGGDEFTLLVRDVSRKEIKAICQDILKDMRDHGFFEDGHSFQIPCSIGATMLRDGRHTPAELMAQADIACHEAKARGRNRLEFYRASGTEMVQIAADISWSEQIRRALDEDRFVLHFQPIAHIETGDVSHYEVLLRMRGEHGRLVPPDAFMPAANRFGLMSAIDEWVIRNGLASLARFREDRPELSLTLNISGNIFEDTDLPRHIRTHLEANDLPASAIILEITEQVAIGNLVNARRQMGALTDLGCRFALDDFGSGYSSYNYLKSLPVDYVKIDGVFIKGLVDDPVDREIVRSICDIAGAAGKQTIAEYVENSETYHLLGRLGVQYAQGYFVGRPKARLAAASLPPAISGARRKRRAS